MDYDTSADVTNLARFQQYFKEESNLYEQIRMLKERVEFLENLVKQYRELQYELVVGVCNNLATPDMQGIKIFLDDVVNRTNHLYNK